jgi:hypothetical protein
MHLSSDGDLDLNTSLDVDDDLLDDLGGRVQVNQTLVDAHLEHIPGLGALTAGSLAGGDLLIAKSANTHFTSRSHSRDLGRLHRILTLRVLVGRRTGPLTRRFLDLARSRSSVQTFSRDWTLREVRVMRILWTLGPSAKSPFSGFWNDILWDRWGGEK